MTGDRLDGETVKTVGRLDGQTVRRSDGWTVGRSGGGERWGGLTEAQRHGGGMVQAIARVGVIAGTLAMWAGLASAGWIFDGRPSTWEGTPEELKADEYVFPVLRLELGGQWTDFELKASTNNFQSLVYYVMSSGTNAYTSDASVWVYFTDDYAADVRKWQKSAPATAIGSQLVDPVNSEVEFAVVCPSHECKEAWQGWMSRTNAQLVWSYVRYDGIALEMNATGTKSHWNPVVPVEWRTARVAP